MKHKLLLVCGLALASLATAQAGEVTVAGTTKGGFNAAAPTSTTTLQGLTFNTGTFSGTTSGGFVGIGGTTNNFGTFTLVTPPAFDYAGTTFALQVTFTLPAGISGSPATFTATIMGNITNVGNGVFINFDNTPQLFTFNDGTTSGSFSLTINDISVNAGDGAQAISGQITGGTSGPVRVPDGGSTVGLLGGACLALAALRRKLLAS